MSDEFDTEVKVKLSYIESLKREIVELRESRQRISQRSDEHFRNWWGLKQKYEPESDS